ncbi:UNC-like C-terminal-domain-containing protein [Multifurca ochricompacta]|uniref:UNC-like C-terminal-domain-containing protein n=1 Tax=Multifurca ochricompacta TaxID=376703 RepID=A0AAD4M398_9AGAM|nr:UNC-like C-terminal-domain-containing protein [Multifurca ochricompacta]
MFISRLSWPLTWLLCLLFASPGLSRHPLPITPYGPFHVIAALAPKPSEEPICCLKPLTPLEPVDDDLFLSFEDWKAKRFSESGSQKGNVPPNSSAPNRVPVESAAEVTVVDGHAPNTTAIAITTTTTIVTDPASPSGQSPTAQTPPASPHFIVPLTDRFNYASLDCSARVHTAHRGAKSASNILSSKRDRYMLSPCSAKPQFVVVELCEDIRIDTVQLANFEFFSGVFKVFTVSVAKTYAATDVEGWTVVDTYVGKNVRGVQSFHPPTSLGDFYRYIRIDFHSHYSNEYYCPISLLRVYGLTHLEQWKWDTWEEESRARQDQNAHATVVHAYANIPSDPEQPAEAPRSDAAEHPLTSQDNSASAATSSSKSNPDAQEPRSDSAKLSESPEDPSDIYRHRPVGTLGKTTEFQRLFHTIVICINIIPTCKHLGNYCICTSPVFPIPIHDHHQPISVGHTCLGFTITPSPLSPPPPPVINLPLSPSPPYMHAGESIYRTIMNRLSALEANTTLYARYVEEQTSAMREMLRRLSEDVGRLEGIGRAQAQFYQRSISDFEKHRREMDIDQRALISQVNYLAEEVVLEKRLGIAQLCLLLAVLVFLSVTRGSPGEFHVPRAAATNNNINNDNDNRNSADFIMREWGRRNLTPRRGTTDWISRLRGVSSGPPSVSNNESTLATALRSPPATAPPPAAAASLSVLTSKLAPAGSGWGSTNTTTTIMATAPATRSRQKRIHLYPTPTYYPHHHHHHHHRTPSLRSAARPRSRNAYHHVRAGSGSPSPVSGSGSGSGSGPVIIPMQRSSSHGGASVIGPVPRSARRWARSAHLHEVRRAHNHPNRQIGGGANGDVDVEVDVFTVSSIPASSKSKKSKKSMVGMSVVTAPSAPAAAASRTEEEDTGAGADSDANVLIYVDVDVDGGVGTGTGSVDTWVDTDTDEEGDAR